MTRRRMPSFTTPGSSPSAGGVVIRRRNLAGVLTAAVLLAAVTVMALLYPAPGHAQTTERQLLSNTGGTPNSLSILGVIAGSKTVAQPFRTGQNSTGYTLTKIQIHGRSATCTAPSTDTITVTLRADSSGEPADTALATFNPPETWSDSGLNDFTLTKVYELDPQTTYHIHMVTTVETCVGRRAADRVDSGSAPDWSFSTRTRLNADGDWEAGADNHDDAAVHGGDVRSRHWRGNRHRVVASPLAARQRGRLKW